jgi:hypothetical protein
MIANFQGWCLLYVRKKAKTVFTLCWKSTPLFTLYYKKIWIVNGYHLATINYPFTLYY